MFFFLVVYTLEILIELLQKIKNTALLLEEMFKFEEKFA